MPQLERNNIGSRVKVKEGFGSGPRMNSKIMGHDSIFKLPPKTNKNGRMGQVRKKSIDYVDIVKE